MSVSTANNFRFINSYSTTGPKSSKETRRDVRSYVARVSHTNADKNRTARLNGDKHRSTVVFDVEITSFQDDEEDGPPLSAPVPRRKKSSLKKLPTPPYPGNVYYNTTQLNFNTCPQYQPNHVQPAVFQNTIPYPIPIEERSIADPNTLRPQSPIHALSTYNLTPISQLPTYHLPYVPAILNNYITKLAGPLPELDDDSPRPLLRTVWLPMVMQNPAIFQVIVLFASAHYAVYAEPSQYARFYAEVLSLKQTALKGLMQGLQSVQSRTTRPTGVPRASNANEPSSSSSSGPEKSIAASARSEPRTSVTRTVLNNTEEECLIAAIAKMASYEAIFGDSESYHTHMRALRALLQRRGGLASLGQDGMLSRLLRFIDTNSAFLLGTNLYLGDDEGVGVCLPRHMPFQMKRFSEMEARGTRPLGGHALEDKLEDVRRVEVAGGKVIDVDRFVGLCGTGDAVRY